MIKNYYSFLNENYTIAKLKFDGDFDLAINFAMQKHHHQIRKFDDTPYIYHPARVAKIILDNTKNKKEAMKFIDDCEIDFIVKNSKKIKETINKLPNNIF